MATAVLAACGPGPGSGSKQSSDQTKTSNQGAAPVKVSTEPVTLKFYAHVAALDQSTFQTYFADVVKRTNPNITLEFSFGARGKLEEWIAAGTIPDILYSGSDNYMSLQDLGVLEDMTDRLKLNGLDLSVFTPDSIQTMRDLAGGNMTGIPFSRNGAALFYNKEMFDKFAVPYPTNGMTYDDVIGLARKMTVTQGGIQYIGWEPGFPDANISPFVQPLVDPKTGKALIDTPAYKKVFEMMKTGYEIPGFMGPKDLFRYTPSHFVNDQIVGMYVDWYNKMMPQLLEADAKGKVPNWDIVTVPNFPEYVGVGRHESVQFLAIAKQSKYKDQAMQVLKAVSSLEAQLLQSRNGRISVLNDSEIRKQFSQDVKAFQGKQMDNLFKFKAASSTPSSIYDDAVTTIVRNVAKEIAVNKKDVNTALREA
ncbi:extracellular solute-binding protein [Paenibacillus ginsengarvi]|nr:extracellular solute-binding protein [Paenibacillus ginsengarvi]